MRAVKLVYVVLVWQLDALNHVLGINWRPLCDHNDRLIAGA